MTSELCDRCGGMGCDDCGGTGNVETTPPAAVRDFVDGRPEVPATGQERAPVTAQAPLFAPGVFVPRANPCGGRFWNGFGWTQCSAQAPAGRARCDRCAEHEAQRIRASRAKQEAENATRRAKR